MYEYVRTVLLSDQMRLVWCKDDISIHWENSRPNSFKLRTVKPNFETSKLRLIRSAGHQKICLSHPPAHRAQHHTFASWLVG